MIFCDNCSPPEYLVCDFCKHYNFNAEDGFYVDKGMCTKRNERREPHDGICDDFICGLAKEQP